MTAGGNRLMVRMRPDLVLTARGAGPSRHWIVEDPVTLKYFRLRDEECFLLRRLDGQASLLQLKESFEERFFPLRLKPRSLNGFLFHLHELGLVIGEVSGQGDVLARRDSRNRLRRRLAAASNPLAIRLPGFPARRLVDRLYPYLRFLFSPPLLVVWVGIVTFAAALVATRFATLQSRLPAWDEFFHPPAMGGFVIALVLTKALHEAGHALVSRHVGGSCREIGVMLLMGMPTLYCDTSDAWRIAGRGPRVMIALAGVAVELVVAAIATLVWWFSEPGVLNRFALQVAFLGSASTLLFNANPLVRADAYYVLADWVDIPNLWQESRALWRRGWVRLVTGQPASDELPGRTSRGRVIALMSYAAASTAYRWLLVGGFLWFLFRWLEPSGLSLLVAGIALPLALSMAVPPIRQAIRTLGSPAGRRAYLNRRLVTVPLVIMAVLVVFCAVPLPHRVAAPFWIDLHQGQTLYASVAGELTEAVTEGTRVEAGEPIVRLRDLKSELRLAELAADVQVRERHLENLLRIQAVDSQVGAMLPAEQQALEDARQRLALHQADHERLVIRSPIAGVVFASAEDRRPRDELGGTGPGRLAPFDGSPLDPVNLGGYVEVGQPVGVIGDPEAWEANLVVHQADIADVRPGQRVTLRLDQVPVRVWTGTIAAIAKVTADEISPAMRQRLGIAQPQGTAPNTAVEVRYQATVRADTEAILDSQQAWPDLPLGATGWAKVDSEWQSLGGRLLRYLRRNFVIR